MARQPRRDVEWKKLFVYCQPICWLLGYDCITFPNVNLFVRYCAYKRGAIIGYHTKIAGNRPRVTAHSTKTCVCVSEMQRGILAIYHTPISTIFEKRTWIGANSREKFLHMSGRTLFIIITLRACLNTLCSGKKYPFWFAVYFKQFKTDPNKIGYSCSLEVAD